VDDHPLFLEGIATVVASQGDMRLAGIAFNAQDALEQFRRARPDITLLDLRLSDMSGIGVLVAIRGESPDARVIMLTTLEGDVEVQRALAAGACGFVSKSAPLEELIAVIRAVHKGRKHLPTQVAPNGVLSQREVEVLKQIAEGYRNKDIGITLCISEETVKVHVRHILDKLDANDRTQAVSIGIRRGIIDL
jgi:DNA-binding NarL/FixJ family response regulator